MFKRYENLIEKYITSLDWLRDEFSEMDDLINPVLGIRDWDDSVCVGFGNKKLVVSVDGPYAKRLVLKSALIHASTDVVVKGAKPLFALDTLIGTKEEIKEMALSLKRQAIAMNIPILGGNTRFEDVEPLCSLTVVGELILNEPIRDSTAKKGDLLILLGEPIWGEQEERIQKALKLFDTWFTILNKGIKINSAKDVTKGGLVPTIYEIGKESGMEFELDEIDLPLTRNLDNFLISLQEKEYKKVLKICKKKCCRIWKIGQVR